MLGQEHGGAGFSIDSVSRFVVGRGPPSGGTSDYAPRWCMPQSEVRTEPAVPRHARLPFVTMPEAAEATLAFVCPKVLLKANVCRWWICTGRGRARKLSKAVP